MHWISISMWIRVVWSIFVLMMWHESIIFVSSTLDDAGTHVFYALDLSDHEYVPRSSFGSS